MVKSTVRVLFRDFVGSIVMSWYKVNPWWVECMVKRTVKSTAESLKPWILKNERKKNITLNIWPFKKGLIIRGWSGSAYSQDVSTPWYLRSCNKNCSLSDELVNLSSKSVPLHLYNLSLNFLTLAMAAHVLILYVTCKCLLLLHGGMLAYTVRI